MERGRRGVLRVYLVSKSGGLIFRRDYDYPTKESRNDPLLQASTFHALSAMAGQLSPQPGLASGIQSLHAGYFSLFALHTVPGAKFLALCAPGQVPKEVDGFLRDIYRAYADLVLKNPFYVLDQVIQSDLFVAKVDELALTYNKLHTK